MIIASESLVAMLKPTYWQFKLEVKIPRWRLLSQGRFNIIDLYLLDDSEMPAVGYSETFSSHFPWDVTVFQPSLASGGDAKITSKVFVAKPKKTNPLLSS